MRNEVFCDAETDFVTVRQAFSRLKPARNDYALVPIDKGFNWDECAGDLQIPDLYVVVFRSVRRADANLEILQEFDDRAHADAQSAPGFVFYFKGQLMPGRECLSFCLWRSRAEARAASNRPDHAAAAGLVREMYESYDLERHILTQEQGRIVFTRLPS
jgi:heme-degrading monooxygenase HmoA